MRRPVIHPFMRTMWDAVRGVRRGRKRGGCSGHLSRGGVCRRRGEAGPVGEAAMRLCQCSGSGGEREAGALPAWICVSVGRVMQVAGMRVRAADPGRVRGPVYSVRGCARAGLCAAYTLRVRSRGFRLRFCATGGRLSVMG
ncbi:hypothetical protein K438DRAFT_1861967 [Mycena galopus ATCC 62051]|nr:hypothetical protein K438DRAFT_1861967 [Mycena galopus ATCC 62051]